MLHELKEKAKQKYQAWQTKPGDIKFTGGKRDITTQLLEDLNKRHRCVLFQQDERIFFVYRFGKENLRN